MKRATKALLTIAAAAAAGAGAAYGSLVMADELLLNRNLELPDKVMTKISKCDLTNLDELLENNLNWLEAYGYKKYYMSSDRGERLVGYLMTPKTKSNTYVFGIHGYRADGRKEFCGFAQYYLKRGINVFFVDHVASGASEGKYCSLGYYEADDSIKWLYHMEELFGRDIKVIVHGVSMGAAVTARISASNLPDYVKMLVADCGYTSAREMLTEKMRGIGIADERIINLLNTVNKRRMGFDIDDISPIKAVKYAKLPMLFIHGREDNFVPWEMSKRNYEACSSENKELLIIDGADHVQSFVENPEAYTEKLDEWIEKFVL